VLRVEALVSTVEDSEEGAGVIESEDEEVELVCVWSCVDGPCCELSDSVELDEDV
jgi:hypothetical protein